MINNINITDELFEYAVTIRRKLHEYPEIGFELSKTVNLISEELRKLDIPYSTDYGKSSIVAHIGNGDEIIAFRADMDALPVEEKTNLPFSSKIKGHMHACGHDAHTAILLTAAKYLKSRENELGCTVRLIFQPSEECSISGAAMMVKNGVMDGVSHIICSHCEPTLPAGTLGIYKGDYMAACVPATIKFYGITSHASIPEKGVDAIAMAIEAYEKMKTAVAEEASNKKYIWSVGRLSGGHVHNVIADLCEMDISFRFYNMDFAERVKNRVFSICSSVAKACGGRCEINWNMSVGSVHNDELISDSFANIVSEANLTTEPINQKMSSEDFGWYLTKAPGMLFRFGTANPSIGADKPAHRNDFIIDENGMKSAIKAFCLYAINYQKNGGRYDKQKLSEHSGTKCSAVGYQENV